MEEPHAVKGESDDEDLGHLLRTRWKKIQSSPRDAPQRGDFVLPSPPVSEHSESEDSDEEKCKRCNSFGQKGKICACYFNGLSVEDCVVCYNNNLDECHCL